MATSTPLARWAAPLCGLIVCAVAVAALTRDYPMVGHDYRYFIPRLLDTLIHLKVNGWSIQWYTPTFGGGLPAYPNPQHLEYSLPQLLTLLVNPWLAVLLTTVVVMMAGFAATLTLLQRHLGLSRDAAALGAVCFIGNGFFFEHMIVGHLGFQLFPMIPVMVVLLIDHSRPLASRASCLGLLAALIVYQGGFQLIIIMAMSIALTMLAIETAGLARIDLKGLSVCAALGAILSLLITAPKLYAVFAMMRFFPRETADIYNVGLPQAVTGLIAQLVLVMPATPVMWLTNVDLMKLTGGMMRLIGASERTGLWEYDTGVSPVLIICLAAGLFAAIKHRATITFDSRRRYAAIALLIAVWLTIEMTLARGLVYPVIQHLPVMRSLHVNPRFAAAFILPLCAIGALSFDRLARPSLRPALTWIALAAGVASPASYLLLPAQSHLRTFDVTRSIGTYQRIIAGDRMPVTRVADVDDDSALSMGTSSLQLYEPLFGYVNEAFRPQIRPGSASLVIDGRFNLTNPAGLVFPELNELNPFSRILADDADNFRAFTEHRMPSWRVPSIHAWLVRLSLITAAAASLAAMLGLRPVRRAP